MGTLKGYKAFNEDWTCRGMKFDVGQTYSVDGEIKLCGNGLHFCINASDTLNYYPKYGKFAEVKATDKWITDGDKSCANVLTIIREISHDEFLRLVNSGHRNSGNHNSGDQNSGHLNSGHQNSGHRNSGNWNSGNWNSGNHNSGNFNSNEPKLRLFNRDTEMSRCEFNNLPFIQLINNSWYNVFSVWVSTSNMTEKEKIDNPSHVTTGGYLRNASYKDAWSMMWDQFTEDQRSLLKQIPNYDSDIFYEITGIRY